jgi:rubrerythrin
MPNMEIPYDFRGQEGCPIQKPYKSTKKAIASAKDSVKDEKGDVLFYDYLISIAPDDDDKEVIGEIRDDEKKHEEMLKELYASYTGNEYEDGEEAGFEKPRDYYDGLRKAFFGEIAAMERYRDIRAGLPDMFHRDMVFEIMTDEMEHADKYNYLLNKNKSIVKGEALMVSASREEEPVQEKDSVYIHGVTPKNSFTMEEAAAVAKQLEVDFAKVGFDLEQLKNGMDVELEHGTRDPKTNVTGDDPVLTGKIALAHLNEFPDYYIRLKRMEDNAKAYWQNKEGSGHRRR